MEIMEITGKIKNRSGDRDEWENIKVFISIIQSFLVILLTYLLSAVREAEIVSTTAIALYILHYFVFYISDYGQAFFKGDI